MRFTMQCKSSWEDLHALSCISHTQTWGSSSLYDTILYKYLWSGLLHLDNVFYAKRFVLASIAFLTIVRPKTTHDVYSCFDAYFQCLESCENITFIL